MYFHPGFAARNAIAAIELAEAGAFALRKRSSKAKPDCSPPSAASLRPTASGLFAGAEPEIMAVYNKPAPGLQFRADRGASRACASRANSADIGRYRRRVSIRVPDAAARYPGCDSKGPFHNALQAKMSIPFSVAAVLARGALEEENYAQTRRSPASSAWSSRPTCKATQVSPPPSRPTRAPRSSSACATEQRSVTPRQCHCRDAGGNPRALSAGRRRRHRRRARARISKNSSTIAHRFRTAGVIAARCRLDPAEQRLRPAS